MKGHRHCDNAILVQEILNHVNKTKAKKDCLMLKLDLEKAFDKIEWSFVYRTLLLFKFPKNITALLPIPGYKTRRSDVALYIHSLHGVTFKFY